MTKHGEVMRLPKIKPMHNPMSLSGGRIRIGTAQYGVGSEIQDDRDGTIWHLLGLLDGTRSSETIVREIKRTIPELDEESVYQVIDTLIASGFVEDAAASPPAELTPAEVARYDRSTNYFAWVDTQPRPSRYEIQRRLKNARVTLLGLGGSGSAVAMSLVATGVGALRCVDFDRVKASNLSRQLLYTEDDVGLQKVERAVSRLRRLNSHVAVTGQELEVRSSDDIVSLMQGCDLFILCADKPPEKIQFWTNEAALRTRTPWLTSLYAGPMLVVGLFVPFQTPCHQCFQYNQDQERAAQYGVETQSLLDVPGVNAVIAPTANLTGHLGALEAIYFLADLQPQTVGRIFHQNLMFYDHFYYVEAPFWPGCPACGPESAHEQTTVGLFEMSR
jgi:molybdopterin/thiamine biosynthesis adenylyltransferase